jgi:hypothetical protein
MITVALSMLAITTAVFANFFGSIASGTDNPPSMERNSRISPVEQNGLTKSTNDFLRSLAKDYPLTKPVP